jgi:excisionase family DNA binding protein
VETLLVNDAEASRLLAISRSKFHELVAQGRIRRIKLGRSARYRRADLVAFTKGLAAEAEDNGMPFLAHTGGPDGGRGDGDTLG